MLDDYEADLRCLFAEIRGLLGAASRRADAQEAGGNFGGRGSKGPDASFGDVENRMREANRVLRQMSLEVRLMPLAPDQRAQHETRLKDHKKCLDEFSCEFEALRRRVLLGEGQAAARFQWAASAGIDPAKEDQDRQANAARTRLLKASRQLEMTRVLVLECEDIGVKTCEDLGRNTDVIKNVKDNVKVVSAELCTGSTSARRMMTHETITNILVRISGWICVAMAAFAVYYYFSRKR